MKLLVQKLEVQGFKSWLEPAILNFELGLHYVRGVNQRQPALGSNGSGKSSLVDALSWCWFGTTTDGLRGPDIRPWGPFKGQTVVAVTAQVGEVTRRFERRAAPNAILLDGKEVGPDKFKQVLGMGYELFKHTMVLGQGQPLFFDLSGRDKMRLFVETMDLDRWDRRAEFASKKLAQRNTRLDIAVGELAGLESSLETVAALKAKAEAEHAEWDADRKIQLTLLKNDLAECQKEQTENQAALNDALLIADEKGMEAKHLAEQFDRRLADLASARHFHNKHEARLESLRRDMKRRQRELEGLGDGVNCPTCGQCLEGTSLAKHKRIIQMEMDELKAELDVGIPAKAVEEVSAAQSQVDLVRQQRDHWRAQEERAQLEANRRRPRDAELKAKITLMESRLAEVEEGINPHRATLQELTKRGRRLQDSLDEKSADVKALEALIARTKFWVKGFKEIRLYVIDEVLEQLEIVSNAILREVGLKGWRIEYSVEKETARGTVKNELNVLILSPDNSKPVKWACWSGGERRRLLIVGALALSEVLLGYAGINTNLEILDEPTQFMGEEGIEDLIEFLAERAKLLKRTILYTDHSAIESSSFTSTLEVTKTRAGSKLRARV